MRTYWIHYHIGGRSQSIDVQAESYGHAKSQCPQLLLPCVIYHISFSSNPRG